MARGRNPHREPDLIPFAKARPYDGQEIRFLLPGFRRLFVGTYRQESDVVIHGPHYSRTPAARLRGWRPA
jgi:hypothetical protein